MDAFVQWLMNTFALPQFGLTMVFMVAFVSATLLPMGSEPVVFGYIKLNPDQFWLCVLVATVANTAGGMVNYLLGRGAHRVVAQRMSGDGQHARALAWLQRLGPKAMFFSFLPAVGDPLTAVGGWLRMPWLPCLLWMSAGKFTRYVLMTVALLWVPDGVW
ncbi:MAG TPA: YqaA family protein, partial [Burkholderiaceae bacterium]|nr:YqaA family protein [Burkholderiaceae bacterium]